VVRRRQTARHGLMASTQPPTGRLHEIDLLRIIAAISAMTYHYLFSAYAGGLLVIATMAVMIDAAAALHYGIEKPLAPRLKQLLERMLPGRPATVPTGSEPAREGRNRVL